MSSGINYEKCPQCGGVYVIELDCSTPEESYDEVMEEEENDETVR